MPEMTFKIAQKRVEQAKEAVRILTDEGINCDWNEVLRTLNYFFENLVASEQ